MRFGAGFDVLGFGGWVVFLGFGVGFDTLFWVCGVGGFLIGCGACFVLGFGFLGQFGFVVLMQYRFLRWCVYLGD